MGFLDTIANALRKRKEEAQQTVNRSVIQPIQKGLQQAELARINYTRERQMGTSPGQQLVGNKVNKVLSKPIPQKYQGPLTKFFNTVEQNPVSQFGAGLIQGQNVGLGRSPIQPPSSSAGKIAYGAGSVLGTLNPRSAVNRYVVGPIVGATNPLLSKAIGPVAAKPIVGRLASGAANVVQGRIINPALGLKNSLGADALNFVTGTTFGPKQFMIGKSMDQGYQATGKQWHPEDAKFLDGLMDKLNQIKVDSKNGFGNITKNEFNKIDQGLSTLSQGYLKNDEIQALTNQYGGNELGLLKAIGQKLQGLAKNSPEYNPGTFSMGITEQKPSISQPGKTTLPTKPAIGESTISPASEIPGQVKQTIPQSQPQPVSFPQKPQELNVNNLNISPASKAELYAKQGQKVLETLGNKKVLEIAKESGLDTKTYTVEQTAEKIAEQLNVRQKVVSLENQLKELRSSNAAPADMEAIIKEIDQTAEITTKQGTDIARQLQARRILANQLDTPLQKVVKLFKEAGVNPDVYRKELAKIDTSDGKAVVGLYRTLVPAKAKDWLDLLRYNSMLSSPNTAINNAFSNLQGSSLIAPVEKTITGAVDALKSALTGSKREYAIGEGGAYLKGTFKAVGEARQRFSDVMTGKAASANPDMKNIPLATKGAGKAVETVLGYPMKLLEATDQFFTTLVEGGVKEENVLRKSKGLKSLNAIDEATKRMFRGELGDNNGSHILNTIDTLANTLQKLKTSKNPITRTLAKFTFPFVKTPTNILKQGVEYSPAGVTTLWGSQTKTEQISKMIMGTSIAAGTAMLLGSDRLSWAEPTDPKKKAAYRAAGMQPYSIKVGNTWVSYSKLHPAIAFNLAMVAAVKDAQDNKKLSDGQAETILTGMSKWLKFFADQSYVKNIGDFISSTSGDLESPAKYLSNYPQQLIPFRALMGWVERIVDPVQRMVDPKGTVLDKQLQQIATQIPLLANKVPERKDAQGNPIMNPDRFTNAVNPLKTSTEKPGKVLEYKGLVQGTKQTQEINQAKDALANGDDISVYKPRALAEAARSLINTKPANEQKAEFTRLYNEGKLTPEVIKEMKAINELEKKGLTTEDRQILLLPEEVRARKVIERLDKLDKKNQRKQFNILYQNGVITPAVATAMGKIKAGN